MSKNQLVKSSSWADETEDGEGGSVADLPPLPAAPPAANPWKKAEPVKPAGLVFEDFEVCHLTHPFPHIKLLPP